MEAVFRCGRNVEVLQTEEEEAGHGSSEWVRWGYGVCGNEQCKTKRWYERSSSHRGKVWEGEWV